jgi:hypothetical protein
MMLVTFTYPTVMTSLSVMSMCVVPAKCSRSPQKLERGLFLIGREHHAEGGEDDVERGGGERKLFCVRFAKRDREIFRERAAVRGLEEIGDVVGGGDFAVASRGGE